MTQFSDLKRLFVAALVVTSLGACGSSQKTETVPPAPTTSGSAEISVSEPAANVPIAPASSSPAPQELNFPEDAFRKNQPVATEPTDFKQPALTRFKLKNGLAVFLIEDHKLPTVSMRLVWDGGDLTDPNGKVSMAGQCMNLVADGTVRLDKLAFEAAQADLASSISAGSNGDLHWAAMSTLTRNLDATAALWAEMLLSPGLRTEDMERNRARFLASLKQSKGNPQSVANRVYSALRFGPKELRGRLTTENSLSAVTLKDCQTFVAKRLKPSGAKLFVAGDITREQIETLGSTALASWKGKNAPAPKPKSGAIAKGRIFFVDVPGSQQSVVSLFHEGPVRKSPDYFATTLMSSILGGGFSSRINMNIREKNGYAYGARGGFSYDRWTGTFSATSNVKRDVTIESLVEIQKEIDGMMVGEVSDEELGREQMGAILSLPANWSTKGQVLASYSSLLYFGLPLNYYETYVAKVQTLNKAALAKAAKKYLKPKNLRILVVGDATVVLPKLKEYAKSLGYADKDLVVLDVDGKKL